MCHSSLRITNCAMTQLTRKSVAKNGLALGHWQVELLRLWQIDCALHNARINVAHLAGGALVVHEEGVDGTQHAKRLLVQIHAHDFALAYSQCVGPVDARNEIS